MKNKSIVSIILSVGLVAFLSKVLGFLREMVLAFYFGANTQTDVFFIAQSMPSTLFPAVCNSFATAFVPLYVSQLGKSQNDGNRFASNALKFSVTLVIVLSFFSVLIMPIAVKLIFPSLTELNFSNAVLFSRIIMIGFPFVMIQYMLSAFLSTHKRYLETQIAGLFFSISLILATIVFSNERGMIMLIISVSFAHFLQAVYLWFVSRKHVRLETSTVLFMSDIKSLVVFTLPILLSNLVLQVNGIVSRSIASSLADGSVSAMNYAQTIDNMLIGVLITSLTLVLYPIMATESGNGNSQRGVFEKGIKFTVMSLVPISVIFSVFADSIVSIIYERGVFDKMAVNLTASFLRFSSLQYAFFGIRELLTRRYYVEKNTKTPLLINVFGMVMNVLLAFILSKKLGVAGIAIANTIFITIVAVLMLVIHEHKQKKCGETAFYITIVKQVIIASLVSTVVAVVFVRKFYLQNHFITLCVGSILVLISYIIMLKILKCEELDELISKAMHMVKRNN
ncbi:MAG: murein biosynthesis integral membrane protein MurJ [Christensenellales bacterium]|jgi:putative peptidoglycan lipid II flippase